MHQISPIHLLIEIEIALRFLLRLSQCLRRGLQKRTMIRHYYSLSAAYKLLFVSVGIQNKCVALNHLAYLNAPESFTPGSQMQELS